MSMLNRWLLFVATPFLFLSLLSSNVASAENESCLTCHSSMKGRIKTAAGALINLNIDTDRFQSSVHGILSCTDCHIRFSDDPHASPARAIPAPVASMAQK